MEKVYRNNSAQQVVEAEGGHELKVEKIVLDGGIWMCMEGAEMPYKGCARAEAIHATNIVKKLILEALKRKSLWLNPKALMEYVGIIGDKVMNSYYIKEEYLSTFGTELSRVLFNLGLNKKLADIIVHVFEYDSAYRFRLQDILSEANAKALINNPRREITRLLAIYRERDYDAVSGKVGKVIHLLKLALLIPSLKNKFVNALDLCVFKFLQFDENDRYWAGLRIDYKFFGEESFKRKQDIRNKGYKVPAIYDNL